MSGASAATGIATMVVAAMAAARGSADDGFAAGPRLVIERFCVGCHAGKDAESGVDLAMFQGVDDLRRDLATWQRVSRVLADGDMPPADAEQPSPAEAAELAGWVRSFLSAEAAARAGDPGPVVLRRLSNAEYTYSIRDLAEIDSLDPAREFPVDGGAGEGFQNTGQALVMSADLLAKYLDAGKRVAAHAVLLPEGIRFSASTERGDWVDEALARLREFYARFTVSRSDVPMTTKQGIALDQGHEGFIPVARYVEATIEAQDRLRTGAEGVAEVAAQRGLSPKYLSLVWRAVAAPHDGSREPSLLIDRLRSRWDAGGPEAAADITAEIAAWQGPLWRFHAAGHIAREFGRRGGPPAWLEPVSPLAARQEFRIPLPAAGGPVTVRLAAGDAGDGNSDDVVVWRRPRILAPGGEEVPVRDAIRLAREGPRRRRIVADQAAACLGIIDRSAAGGGSEGVHQDWESLARADGVDPLVLAAWAARVGVARGAATGCGELLVDSAAALEGKAGVDAWTGPNALSVVANSNAETHFIPGTIPAGGVALHPAPDRRVVVGWKPPVAEDYLLTATVARAHVGCGNGVAWGVEWRRGGYRQSLASGRLEGDAVGSFSSASPLPLLPGDMICLVVEPVAGDHACDLSTVSFEVSGGDQRWNLAADVAADLLAGNPHADASGRPDVWHFASEPTGSLGDAVPDGSLLARWQVAPPGPDRAALAAELGRLLGGPPPPAESPDAILRRQLLSLTGSLVAAADPDEAGAEALDPRFGAAIGPLSVGPLDLAMTAPAGLELELAGGFEGEFVVTAEIHPQAGSQATVQVTASDGGSPPPAGWPGPAADAVFLARPETAGWDRLAEAFAAHRRLFPPAACYGRIVPVDEVVTFNLLYREDDRLRELLLDDGQAAELDRLWEELRFVSDEPLELLAVYEQLMEFATQDANTLRDEFLPVREPLEARADAFRRQQRAAEPRHLEAVEQLAERAFRRPLAPAEEERLRGLYAALRADGLPHEEAVRLVIARVLVSPEFLYKPETPPPGTAAAPLGGHELASRLSSFLWSSLPDDELRREAAAGRLADPAVLVAQSRRMMADPRIRRLATEFGTHWLHVANFAEHDEKSPAAFPEFAAVRGSMFEEAVLLLTELFRDDRPVLSLVDADHTFLDGTLAALYGIPGVTGDGWRRVDGVRRHGRGGILSLGATLAKQSGASRTSPILRGTWVTEALLGQRVPKPPKGVPPLAETAPAGLSERELTALHTQDARCAGCHARFDPFGFALEGFDAIGRRRDTDVAGRPIDTAATLPDGTRIDGHAELASYLAGPRSADFLRQFCRKLLGYALGRGIQLGDEPLLGEMQARLKAADGRVSAAVETIVTSPQFRSIRGAEAGEEHAE